MRRITRRLLRGLTLVAGLAVLAEPVFAQQTGAAPDSVAHRIQQLVLRGDASAARRLVDSVLVHVHMHVGSTDPRYGEALYWRAVLTTSPDSTRRDLLRLVVDYPYSPWMEDALIRLANAELVSGNRASARRHLERMVRDHMVTDGGARAARQLAELMIADGSVIAACNVVDSARSRVSPSNVELANQLTYTGRTCEQVRAAAEPVTTDARQPERRASGSPPQPPLSKAEKTTDRRRVEWSVQVAAYGVRGDASRLAARLLARGYETRITVAKPYRVRIGRFTNRAEAADVVAKLKTEKTAAIIVEAERK